MRTRKLSLVAAATALAATAWMTPAAASIPPGICSYPPNSPFLSLNSEFTVVQKGQRFTIGGNFTRNRCPLPGGRIGLFTRTQPGPFTYLTQTVSNSAGHFEWTLSRNATTDFLALFSGEGSYPGVVSRVVHVSVVG